MDGDAWARETIRRAKLVRDFLSPTAVRCIQDFVTTARGFGGEAVEKALERREKTKAEYRRLVEENGGVEPRDVYNVLLKSCGLTSEQLGRVLREARTELRAKAEARDGRAGG